MMKTQKFPFLLIVAVLVLLQSCKKNKAENGLEGYWTVNSSKTESVLAQNHPLADTTCGDFIVFSGEFFVNEDGNGYAHIYGEFCDSTQVMFYKEIENLRIIDHSGDMNYGTGSRSHWYQGYFNDDIYFNCHSMSDKGVINKKTTEISLNINGLIDQSTGGYLEDYSLFLILTRP